MGRRWQSKVSLQGWELEDPGEEVLLKEGWEGA